MVRSWLVSASVLHPKTTECCWKISLRRYDTLFGVQGGQSYKDPNIAAHHFHGHYGNPGTNNIPCDPPAPAGVTCYRGDNIYADIMPGHCNEYQYDVSPVTSPGTFW